jgi:chromosome segregation ATPase
MVVSPSKRSLQAAAIAGEGQALSSATSADSPAEHLLKLAAELKERIDVLRILDGTAPQWPGITNCIEMLYDVAAEASEGLKQAHQAAQQLSSRLQQVNAKLQVQQERADEAEDALAASNSENNALSMDLEQTKSSLERVKSEIAQERVEKELMVCRVMMSAGSCLLWNVQITLTISCIQ